MIRCKRCGNMLSDTARVCKRCGISVKRENTNKKTVPSKNSRYSSRDSYDRYRKKKMQIEIQRKRRKRRFRMLIFWLILVAVAAAVFGGMYANKNYTPGIQTPAESTPVQTPEPVISESPLDEEPESTPEGKKVNVTQNLDEKAEDYGCSIYTDASYDFKCAYPSKFVDAGMRSGDKRASFKEESDDATTIIYFEKISKTDSIKSLFNEYKDGIGVSPDDYDLGENTFSITFRRNGEIKHRKAVVVDDMYIYYDFFYNQNTVNKSEYEKYIDFMDMYIEQNLDDGTAKTN